MSKILIKRGSEANLPTLDTGELAVTLDTKKLFVGSAEGNVELSKVGVNVKTVFENGTFSEASNTITINFDDFDETSDMLILTIGGLVQTKGVDFTLSGNLVTKASAPDWRAGYVYDIIIIKNYPLYTPGDKIPLDYYESRNVLSADSNIATIGISEYNMTTDVLLVFLNGDKLLRDTEFSIDNDTQISKTNGTWLSGDKFDFLVMKTKTSLSDTYDGRVLLEKSVSIDSFEDSLQDKVNNVIEDDTTGDKYVWAVNNGTPYLKLV